MHFFLIFLRDDNSPSLTLPGGHLFIITFCVVVFYFIPYFREGRMVLGLVRADAVNYHIPVRVFIVRWLDQEAVFVDY